MNTVQAVNTEVLKRFQKLVAAKRLAHAYLFAGPAQTGKMETALVIAQLVNCSESGAPCGRCESCHKIIAGNHPDIHLIGKADEDTIKIDEIRYLLSQAGLRAYEARTKVFVLRNAERMTTEAANALLKTLEEPAPNTLMLLTTAVPEACLGTIKSRCHTVKFFAARDILPQESNRILDIFLNRGNNEEYFKELSSDRPQTGQAMLVLLSWVRDVMLYKNGIQAGQLAYGHRTDDLQKMSRRNMQELSELNKQIVRVKSLADDNFNVKMALELMKERLWAN